MEMVFDWRSMGSFIASLVFLRTVMRDFIPIEVQMFLRKILSKVLIHLRPTANIIIDESEQNLGTNDLYDSAQIYLGTRCLSNSLSVKLYKQRQSISPVSSLPDSHTTVDLYQGVPLTWTLRTIERPRSNSGHNVFNQRGDTRSLELMFHQKHRKMVHDSYIPYVINEVEKIRMKSRERRLFTNRSTYPGDDHHRLWSSHAFNHPSTFETLAIETKLREEIRNDLLRFSDRKDHYSSVGRAWKRGYLLHGPPGTGKTSLVAAIANLLDFDVYDLELTTVPTNSHLRRLLVSTTPKSVVVVEDVDCSLDLSDRKQKHKNDEKERGSSSSYMNETISLSGVLNFVDGLWSSCVGERLIIFTTNHPERLDPALLRPGRMDRKIELGYCSGDALRVLGKNYLELKETEMEGMKVIGEIESLLGEVNVTPADVAEVFMGSEGDSAYAALDKLVAELRRRQAAPVVEADE